MEGLALLLADGRFPGGGHAHSAGLEAAVAEGVVADLEDLEAFVAGRLAAGGATDAWLAARACAGDDPAGLEAECEARLPSPALRAAGRSLGRGLRRAAALVWPALAEVTVAQQPVVLGLVARAAGLSPRAAGALVLHGATVGPVAAAPRLLPVDTAEAMAVAVRLAPLVTRLLDEAMATDPPPVRGAPALELRAERHARWEVRLFAS